MLTFLYPVIIMASWFTLCEERAKACRYRGWIGRSALKAVKHPAVKRNDMPPRGFGAA